MNTHIIHNISEFVGYVSNIKSQFGNLGYQHWFRAESCLFNETSLIPNIFREYVKGASAIVEFYKKENGLTALYQHEAYKYVKDNGLLHHNLGTRFLMQHYGAQTRLLDWTENAMISLFFAVENIESKSNAIIWILDPLCLNSESQRAHSGIDVDEFVLYPTLKIVDEIEKYFDTEELSLENPSIKYPIALKPFYIDERMKNQSTCFSLFGHSLDGLKEHPGFNKFMRKIEIPFTSFRTIKRDLYKIGISYDTIYPGLEGISKKTNYAFDEYFI